MISWLKSDYLKMQYSGKFKIKDAIKNLQAHVSWRNSIEFHTLSQPNLEFLKEGILYIHGRDK
jgi:hypothetical protein